MIRALFLLLLLVPLAASAQLDGAFSGNATPAITIKPEFPAPGSTVTASVETYSFPVVTSRTVWRVNGAVFEEGTGIRQITYVLPEDGTPVVLDFLATTDGGDTREATYIVTPGVVDVIVEGDGYAPDWYEGAVLPRYHGTARLVAFPTIRDRKGALVDPKSLIYTWKDEDERTLLSYSGVGRQSAIIDNLIPLRTREVVLTVASRDGTIRTGKRILIKPAAPAFKLYRVSPLFGIDTKRVLSGTYTLSDEEVVLSVEPFGAEGRTRDAVNLTYGWRVNSRPVESGNTDKGTITLRTAGTGRGSVPVSVEGRHPERAFLSGKAEVALSFSR